MDVTLYKRRFQDVVNGLDKELLHKKELEVAVVEVLDSMVLKLYKRSWANENQDPLTARSRIFFAIWVNDKTLKQDRLYYNIHALKLRELEGYKITSWDFADNFRKQFKDFKDAWPNVRLDYGPLTLMEGWTKLDDLNLEDEMRTMVKNFFKIDAVIDELLKDYKKQ